MLNDKDNAGKQYSFTLRDAFFVALGFAIVILSYVLPTPSGLEQGGQVMIGILLMAAVFWIAEPIPLAATGLLIMIVQPIVGIVSADAVFSSFGNEAVFFLIGAFIIASAVEKHGLHRRVALRFLSYFEKNPRVLTLGIMCSCAFLSFIIPEHGVAALFLPIATAILIANKVVPRESNFGKISMLSVAYGCSIGSLGTLIGGARNPLTIGMLSDVGINVSFFEWMTYSMPVVLISLPLVWIILQMSFPLETKDISQAKEEINKQLQEKGKMKRNEKLVAVVLGITIFLWVFLSSPEYLGLAVIAILGSILLFFTGSISWKDVEERVPWGIILLYGGAITLGKGMSSTGAGEWMAHLIFSGVGENLFLVVLVLIVVTILLTNAMSNMAAVAILLPIGFGVASQVPGVSPLLAAMIIALSGGLAFMLVIATPGNAITYSAGYFSTRDLLKAGTVANIACILVVFIVAIAYWKGVLGL